LPCGAAVLAAVDAIAGGEIGADVRLAGANVDDVGVGRRNGQRSNGSDGLVVEDGLPHHARIRGLPHATIHAAKVEGAVAARDAADGNNASSAERADQTPA